MGRPEKVKKVVPHCYVCGNGLQGTFVLCLSEEADCLFACCPDCTPRLSLETPCLLWVKEV